MKNEEAFMVIVSMITALLIAMLFVQLLGFEAVFEELDAIEKAVTQ